MSKEYKVWVHGHDGWKFSQDCQCFIYRSPGVPFDAPPTAYCLGDRYIHCAPGIDTYGVIWQGSTSENWHGRTFGTDLTAALRWIQEAEARKLGCKLWSKPEYELAIKSHYE